jgi:hypothetical protein
MIEEIEINEEEQKIDAVVSDIPVNYLVDNSSKSKILFKTDNSNGHTFVEVVHYFLEKDVEITSEKLFKRLKHNWCNNYDAINDFMNALNGIKSKYVLGGKTITESVKYVIVTKSSMYGNTQVRNYVKKSTPNYQWTKAYQYGYFVHIPTLYNIWNNFKVDFKAIDEAKKEKQKVRYDFNSVKEVKRQLKIRNDKIEQYKNDLEFFFFDKDSLEAEIQNQTLRVVKTVRREPSETEDRFHRVLKIIEKLHPKSQSNIKRSEYTTSGESYEIREWKKGITVTREEFSNYSSYCELHQIDEDILPFRDLTISLLDLDEANHYILDLVSQVANIIEDIVLNE